MEFIATCARGFEKLLVEELKTSVMSTFDISVKQQFAGGMRLDASFEAAMAFCLHSRLATRLSLVLAKGNCHSQDDVYRLSKSIKWNEYIDENLTFKVRAHCNHPRIDNAHFISLRVKDGIVDSFRASKALRPSVDTKRPDVLIYTQVLKQETVIALELQGINPLSQRGYRQRFGNAPLRETLAASMIAYGQWHADRPFRDPMCGSGTIAIEAAMLATQTAPGIQRHFGFEKWKNFALYERQWQKLRSDAKRLRRAISTPGVRIVASDVDPAMVKIAQTNAKTAGVDAVIDFVVADIRRLPPLSAETEVVVNPPYGERLDDIALTELYFEIGRRARQWDRHWLTILSRKQLLKKHLHMKPCMRASVYNGPIECEIARYHLGKSRDAFNVDG